MLIFLLGFFGVGLIVADARIFENAGHGRCSLERGATISRVLVKSIGWRG
jgi:hypothetical protein